MAMLDYWVGRREVEMLICANVLESETFNHRNKKDANVYL